MSRGSLQLRAITWNKPGSACLPPLTVQLALRLVRAEQPALLVLDLMLPEVNGLDVIRALRLDPTTRALPVIMLTARVDESDRVSGLELGADDYMTKPFSPRELVARVRAVLRRGDGDTDTSGVLHVGELTIDFQRRSVRRAGMLVDLTATEFDLLAILARAPGRPFTRTQLIELAYDVTLRRFRPHGRRAYQESAP